MLGNITYSLHSLTSDGLFINITVIHIVFSHPIFGSSTKSLCFFHAVFFTRFDWILDLIVVHDDVS